jgi:hypothetical protein
MDNPLVNGIAWGWAEIELSIDGQHFSAVKSINYKTSVQRGKVRGTSMRVLGLTSGEADQEGDLELAMDDYRALLTMLGDGYLKRQFDIAVSYSNEDGVNLVDNPFTYTDQLKGCRLKGTEHSHSQGPEGLTVKLPLDIMQILEGDNNGNFLDGLGSDSAGGVSLSLGVTI